MKFRFLILLVFSLSFIGRATAQEGEYTQSRILFLLDESSSMLQPWAGGKQKYKIANEIIEQLMDSVNAVNSKVQFSLRVFGNQHTVPEHDCHDTKNEVPFSPDNRTQMSFRLEDMHPLGVTAIAYSLSQAAENDLVDEAHNAYSIILLTDGGESCDGDICGVMQRLIKNKVYFKPYILSLEDAPELKNEYACMGDYLPVTKKADITVAVNTIVEAFRPMLKISKAEYQKMQVIAAKAPSALKVNLPPIKTEDPEPIKPVPVKPKPVDSVIAPVKTSSIVVGEEPKPQPRIPVKLKKTTYAQLQPMFVGKARFTQLTGVAVTAPEITVSEEDITVPHPAPVAVKRVTLRDMKKLPVSKVKFEPTQAVVADAPEIKIDLPAPPPPPVKLAKVEVGSLQKFAVKKPKPYKAPLATLQEITINVDPQDLPPVRTAPIQMDAIAFNSELSRISIKKPELKLPKKFKAVPPVIKGEEPDPVVTEPVAPPVPVVVRTPLKMSRLKWGVFRMHLLYVNVFMDSDLKPAKLPPVPVFKTEPVAPPKPTTVAKVNPIKPTTPATTPKTGEYKVEYEDSKETTLEIYLTNGKGKFFTTTPRVILIDPVTNKELKQFYRTVDENGNPDPVTNLAVGKYDLTLLGRNDLLAHVDLQQNKHNKVYIKVKDYSLYFYYENAPTRPVTEFEATVIQRNTANGKVAVQKCSEKKEYEPGNYHITINTFPINDRNMDLDAMTEGGIAIAQPGFAKFTSEVNTSSIALYKELGDKFVQFATLNLNDPRCQHLQIQPGRYQVHYNNGTSKFASSERVITFFIKSLQETEIKLIK